MEKIIACVAPGEWGLEPDDESPEFTILMPCLNEEKTVGDCIRKAFFGLRMLGLSGEVLIADNGSTDRSASIAKSLGARVIHVKERGYGSALRAGIGAACGKYVVMGDCDCSYDFGDIVGFVEKLRGGADLVMGCRMPAGRGKINRGAMPWLHRWIGNPGLTAVGRLLFGCECKDFHCGLRGFRRSTVGVLDFQSDGMEFASEMVIKAAKANLGIEEVPITLHKDQRDRPPHLRTWVDGWRHLRFMLVYSPRWVLLYPGALLSFLGGIAFLALFISPITVGDVELSVNTMLFAAMATIVGVQAIWFWVLSREICDTKERMSETQVSRKIITLELLLGVGGLLLICGTIAGLGALFAWADHGFGPLYELQITRLSALSMGLIVLGVQTVFSAFMLGIVRTRPGRSVQKVGPRSESILAGVSTFY